MAVNSIKLEVSEKNLINNVEYLKNKYNKKILPVIKADAYGHGMGLVSQIFYEKGYKEFAVARLSEAKKILENKKLSDCRVLIFESVGSEYFSSIEKYDSIDVTANTFSELEELLDYGIPSERIQIKIDFGFGRNGLKLSEIQKLKEYMSTKNLKFKGIYSHLYAVEYQEGKELLEKFHNILKFLGEENFQMVHMQNSIGTLFYGDAPGMTHLRVGAYTYGLQEEGFFHEGLKRVFSLKGEIAGVRDIENSRYLAYNLKSELGIEGWKNVAKIKIGYGDGFIKSNEKSNCLINGKPYKILSVTMDNTFIQVDESVKEGDEVELYPDLSIVRENTGMPIFELLTLLNERIERVPEISHDLT
ncbi:MAG: alanine racemase [Fusobacteriaceae bacterium]